MKIGQFGESFIPVIDGVGRVMKAYAETMTARGHEVYVIAPMYDTGYRGQYPFEIVDFISAPVSKKYPWRVGFESFDPHFANRMKQIDLDIIHVHGPVFAGNCGLHFARKRHVPIVGSFHTKFYDDILQTTGMKLVAKMGARAVADFYSKCDEVWTVSEGTAETLHEYGYKGNIVIMPNGTNKRTLDQTKVPEVIERYKIRQDVPLLLFVGQLSWKKNLKTTIEACGALRRDGVDFQLLMAGQGPDEDAIKNLVKAQGIEKNTIFTGHLTDAGALDAIYSIGDLFVFPSTYDNAPMVVREAAAQYTPTLAVSGSCTAEIITHMKNGIITENTSADVASGIKSFLSLPKDKKDEIGKNAYDTIPIPWDGKLMDNILGRYQDLIERNNLKNRKGN